MKFIKGLGFSLASIFLFFAALVLPFFILGDISKEMMHILFVTEMIVYFVCGCVFLIIVDKTKEKAKKEKYKRYKREERKNENISYNNSFNEVFDLVA